MGYYLPPKSYLRPKPRINLRQKLIVVTTTSIIMLGAAIIFTSLQFGDYKSMFAQTHDAQLSTDIPMPVTLTNSNIAIAEGPHPYEIDFPVVLAYFKTNKSTKSVELKWSTMMEYKNDFFTVEKSTNGTEFREIGCVDSKKSDELSSDYAFIDDSVPDQTTYYRLLQTSSNGKSTYIALEKVKGKSEIYDMPLYIEQVGPQPFSNFFNVNYYSNRSGGISVELFDKSGKKIYKTYTDAIQGYNTCKFIDGENLIDDEYTLRIANSTGAFVKRIKKKV